MHDADALYAEWSRPGIGGQTLAVCLTPYQLREGAHIDPDGNLIRFGSPIPDSAGLRQAGPPRWPAVAAFRPRGDSVAQVPFTPVRVPGA